MVTPGEEERKRNGGGVDRRPTGFSRQQHGEFKGLPLRAWRINDKCPSMKEISAPGILCGAKHFGGLLDEKNPHSGWTGTLQGRFVHNVGFSVPGAGFRIVRSIGPSTLNWNTLCVCKSRVFAGVIRITQLSFPVYPWKKGTNAKRNVMHSENSPSHCGKAFLLGSHENLLPHKNTTPQNRFCKWIQSIPQKGEAGRQS